MTQKKKKKEKKFHSFVVVFNMFKNKSVFWSGFIETYSFTFRDGRIES